MRTVQPLPDVRSGASVVVIGAGMAGLCAAYELSRTGCSVTVLEARREVGGRVRTRRDFPDGLYVEEGATRFPVAHHYTMHYLREFDLPVIAFDRPDMGHTLRIMSRDVESHPWGQDAWPDELPLHDHERALDLDGLHALYVAPMIEEIGDPLSAGWPSADLRERFDTVGFADLLRSRGASEGAIRALSLGFHVGEGLNSVSALWWLETMALDVGPRTAVKVDGGNDRLARAFVDQLGDGLHLGCVVQRVVEESSGVAAYAQTPRGEEVFRADYAVCTLPVPLVLDVAFDPELPRARREALEVIPYASLSRVALQCRHRFWLDQGRPGFEDTDEEIAEVWDLTVGEPGERGVLVAYSGGNEARRVTAMSEQERISYTAQRLEPLLPGLLDNLEGGVSLCWDAEPYARGGGAWFRPGQSGLREVIAAPQGRIHFAGEATSPWPGWVQGAFESARRATGEILERSAHATA